MHYTLLVVMFASVMLCSACVHALAQQQAQQDLQQLLHDTATIVQPATFLQERHCQAMYSARREMTPEEAAAVAVRLGGSSQQFCPALLWTYTGTGNTMTRMLIEVASGWYTGSVYTGER
jgi:hypothetical protein